MVIDWNRVTFKATTIEDLKHPVKNIRQNVVFESCACSTNRLHCISQNNGDCLR